MATLSEVITTTLTATIEDPDEDATYVVEHESDDHCIYVWKTYGGTREIALSISPNAARVVADALRKCADKAEGKVA